MTTTVAPPPTRAISFATAAAAVLLPVGPAAIAVLRLILPYYTADSSADMVAAVQAHPGRQSAVVWLGYAGLLILVPGLFAVARTCRDAAPRLTAWALALAVPGYLSLGVMLTEDQLLWSATHAGLSRTDAGAVVDASHPVVGLSIGVFVVGHVIGTVLIGLALVRSARIPAWAGWAVAISQPLHFVATVFLGSPAVDFVGWSLMAIGLGLVGRELVRGTSSS